MNLAILYCCNCDCKFDIFFREWTANLVIFGHEKFVALVVGQEILVTVG